MSQEEVLDMEFQSWTPEDFVYFGRKALLRAVKNCRRFARMSLSERLERLYSQEISDSNEQKETTYAG